MSPKNKEDKKPRKALDILFNSTNVLFNSIHSILFDHVDFKKIKQKRTMKKLGISEVEIDGKLMYKLSKSDKEPKYFDLFYKNEVQALVDGYNNLPSYIRRDSFFYEWITLFSEEYWHHGRSVIAEFAKQAIGGVPAYELAKRVLKKRWDFSGDFSIKNKSKEAKEVNNDIESIILKDFDRASSRHDEREMFRLACAYVANSFNDGKFKRRRKRIERKAEHLFARTAAYQAAHGKSEREDNTKSNDALLIAVIAGNTHRLVDDYPKSKEEKIEDAINFFMTDSERRKERLRLKKNLAQKIKKETPLLEKKRERNIKIKTRAKRIAFASALILAVWRGDYVRDEIKAHGHGFLGDWYGKGQEEKSLQHYLRAVELMPERKFFSYIYSNIGLIYKQQGKYDKAEGYLKKAIEINPEDADAHNNLGNVYRRKDMIEKAIEEYELAMMSDPEYAGVYFNLGQVYFHDLNNPEKAEKYYKKAVELKPKDMHYRQMLNSVKEKLKEN